MTFFFNEIMNVNLKDYRVLVVGVKFENVNDFEIFDFERVLLMKRESYFLKY